MKKAVFFDIDGTLWDHHMRIPESTSAAVRRLRENGHYAFICSGRARAAIQAEELLEGIGFDGILAACGTYIEYRGEVIYERTLAAEEFDVLFACAAKHRLSLVLEGKNCLYADMEDFEGNVYIHNLKKTLERESPEIGFLPLAVNMGKHDADKATAYFHGGDLEQAKRELAVKFDLVFHSPEVFEIIPKGFSKASGIRRICEYLQIARTDTYAFGDSGNDIEMLQYSGCGIAMGNGTKEAKEAADYVTSDLWKDGIRDALVHFSLI